jgi:hypothetical protein
MVPFSLFTPGRLVEPRACSCLAPGSNLSPNVSPMTTLIGDLPPSSHGAHGAAVAPPAPPRTLAVQVDRLWLDMRRVFAAVCSCDSRGCGFAARELVCVCMSFVLWRGGGSRRQHITMLLDSSRCFLRWGAQLRKLQHIFFFSPVYPPPLPTVLLLTLTSSSPTDASN